MCQLRHNRQYYIRSIALLKPKKITRDKEIKIKRECIKCTSVIVNLTIFGIKGAIYIHRRVCFSRCLFSIVNHFRLVRASIVDRHKSAASDTSRVHIDDAYTKKCSNGRVDRWPLLLENISAHLRTQTCISCNNPVVIRAVCSGRN